MLTFSLHAPPPFYCLLVQAVKSAIDVQAAAALKTLPIEEKVCHPFFDFFLGGGREMHSVYDPMARVCWNGWVCVNPLPVLCSLLFLTAI